MPLQAKPACVWHVKMLCLSCRTAGIAGIKCRPPRSLPLQYMINRRALRPGNDAHKEEEGGSIFSHKSSLILACTSTARPPQPSRIAPPSVGRDGGLLFTPLALPFHPLPPACSYGSSWSGKTRKEKGAALFARPRSGVSCVSAPTTHRTARPPGKNTASFSSRLSLLLLVFYVICIIYVLFCHRFRCDFIN